jgi:carboxypeptidase C (cathepsin A)
MRLGLLIVFLFLQDKDPSVVTEHVLAVNGEKIAYVATTGTLTIKNDADKPQAKMFYIAYTKKDADPKTRPLTFSFNGGPGSSSVWLHLGLLGPKRVDMKDDASIAKPPYALVENTVSLLDKTDLVFIDPVTTGYSRPAEGVEAKAFHGVEEDLDSVGRFIHLYTSRANRWASPKFLIGESYGTTRAAGLSALLQDAYGMELAGVMLVSSILNFNTTNFATDLSYALYLPTYTATAWYHKKLAHKDLASALRESEEFAMNEYTLALMKGHDLPNRKEIAAKLSRLTGLSETYLEQANLRVSLGRFCKELRRSDRLTVGRLDSRYVGEDPDAAGEQYGYDPSMSAIQGPYSEGIYKYLRNDLQYQSDQIYEILTGKVRPWNYGKAGENRVLDVSGRLRNAMAKNPRLKVFVASGYYDQATPYFATKYTFSHMDLEPERRKNVTIEHYEAGHMMYIHGPSLKKLRDDLVKFYDAALAR